MTIASYSDLTSAISDRLARADMSAGAASTAECIVLCEAEMRRRLRTRDMETLTSALPVNGEYVPVPADFAQVRAFAITSSNPRVQLTYLTPEMQTAKYPLATPAQPRTYSVIGNQFRFAPPPDATYMATLVYYAKIPALATNLTNWVINDHPDAYLYGSLAQAAIRLQDPDAYQYYKGFFDQALAQMQTAADKARWSGPGLATVPS